MRQRARPMMLINRHLFALSSSLNSIATRYTRMWQDWRKCLIGDEHESPVAAVDCGIIFEYSQDNLSQLKKMHVRVLPSPRQTNGMRSHL